MATFVAAAFAAGCGPVPSADDGTDGYLGSATCESCHRDLGTLNALHGHRQALKSIQGAPPAYPDAADRAGVPSPPAGISWPEVGWVVGGYTRGANYVDIQGYLLTDGVLGTHAQYNLYNAPAKLPAGFVAYRPSQAAPLPFEYGCFRCHTTAPEWVDTNGGQRQNNRPGVGGTWVEDGVGCEACHGPGALHVANPWAGNIVVDSSATVCGQCHVDAEDPSRLAAAGGFVRGYQQYTELAASPHAGFDCNVCHDPHASTVYDPSHGVRNQCLVCHAEQNLARHSGRTFVLGDYVEIITCQSCHMPFASKTASSNTFDVFGDTGGVGDARTHVFAINTVLGLSMFTPDGSAVALDEDGKAAVTLDFVCLRCHNGRGSAFALTMDAASSIARGIHDPP